MALTTYVSGEILTAQSLNDNLAYAVTVPASTPGGLTLISATTIGTAVTGVTVTGASSATYDAYKIIISGGTASASNDNIKMKLGSTTSGYYAGWSGATFSSGANISSADNAASSWTTAGFTQTDGINFNLEIINPFLANKTFINGVQVATVNARNFAGYLNDTTSYTAFTLTPNLGTLTGGNIRVYGYSNS